LIEGLGGRARDCSVACPLSRAAQVAARAL